MEILLGWPVPGSIALLLFAIFFTLLFRKQIEQRLAGGGAVKATIGQVRVSLDPPGKGIRQNISQDSEIAPSPLSLPTNTPRSRLLDPRLQHLTPPIVSDKFQTVYLPTGGQVQYFPWPFAPIGILIIHEVPFYLEPVFQALPPPNEGTILLGHQALNMQPLEGNRPNRIDLPISVTNATAVHFLISAGNGWARYGAVNFLNERIGHIELTSKAGQSQRCDLELGNNVREWAFGNDPKLVRDVDYNITRPAWVSHDNTKRFDFMTLTVQSGPVDLETISLVVQFGKDVTLKHLELPSVIIGAITCERQV